MSTTTTSPRATLDRALTTADMLADAVDAYLDGDERRKPVEQAYRAALTAINAASRVGFDTTNVTAYVHETMASTGMRVRA